MLVEQAIFTSARTSRHQGYQVVGRSPGITEKLSQTLARWCPTHGSLTDSDVAADSLNFAPIDQQWLGLSRTMYGGPEYSGRGALQVVTLLLALERKHLRHYDNNPVTLALTAQMLGHLWLPSNLSAPCQPVELPDEPPRSLVPKQKLASTDRRLVKRATTKLPGERVAIVGASARVSTLGQVFDSLSLEERLSVSFTTGLSPSQHRPFDVHMIPKLDAQIHARLSQQGIRFVAADV